MKQEDKQLLLKDLCARLPYGVHLFTNSKHHIRLLTISRDLDYDEQYWINGLYDVDEVKPYLRTISSMTDEEHKEYEQWLPDGFNINTVNWLLEHHFDFMGLIPKGLAIEVTEENNPYKE